MMTNIMKSRRRKKIVGGMIIPFLTYILPSFVLLLIQRPCDCTSFIINNNRYPYLPTDNTNNKLHIRNSKTNTNTNNKNWYRSKTTTSTSTTQFTAATQPSISNETLSSSSLSSTTDTTDIFIQKPSSSSSSSSAQQYQKYYAKIIDATTTTTTTTTTDDDNNNNVVEEEKQSNNNNVNCQNNVAIIFNLNARSVNNDIIQIANTIFNETINTNCLSCKQQIYVTSTMEEGKSVAKQLAKQIFKQQNQQQIQIQKSSSSSKSTSNNNNNNDYLSMIIPVGGDGTVTSMINYICHELLLLQKEQNELQKQQKQSSSTSTSTSTSTTSKIETIDDAISILPYIGYIPLGTGNGVGSVVGNRKSYLPSHLFTKTNKKTTKSNKEKEENDNDNDSTMSISSSTDTNKSNNNNNRIRTFISKCITFFQTKIMIRSKQIQQKELSIVMEQLKQIAIELSSLKQQQQQNTNNNNKPPMLLSNYYDTVEIPMMELSTTTTTDDKNNNNKFNELCFFAGVGFDSLMLQDFKTLKSKTSKKLESITTKFLQQKITQKQKSLLTYCKYKLWKQIHRIVSSVAGYCIALVTMTLPKCIFHKPPAHQIHVEITSTTTTTTITTTTSNNENNNNNNENDDIYWIDHRRGDVIQPIKTTIQQDQEQQEQHNTNTNTNTNNNNNNTNSNKKKKQKILLYNGIAGIVACGTVPYYGGGLKLFPFSLLNKNKFHLRIGRIHPLIGFFNIPQIFKGTYRDQSITDFGCLDYLCNNISIKLLQQQKQKKQSKQQKHNNNNIEENNNNNHNNNSNDEVEEEEGGYPVQHSGESIGICNEVHLRIVSKPIRFVTLLPKRIVYDTITTTNDNDK